LKKDAGNGANLFDHLANVLLTITKENPANPLEQFELISAKLKQNGNAQAPFREVPAIAVDAAAATTVLDSAKALLKLIKPVAKEGEELPEQLPVSTDLHRQMELFESAGRGLGREEAYKLVLSIRRLATEKDLSEVRIFGKIFGTNKDYYIIECKLPSWPEEADEPEDSKNEPWGSGVNSYAYFATNSVVGKWELLPRALSNNIILARQMRRFFTGDLNAKVYGFPRFPGAEKDYLRAQIARISASTLISPRGAFTAGDDDAVVADEEFRGITAEELIAPDGWIHSRAGLLKQGRVEPWVAPEKEEGDEGDDAEPQEEPEEAVAPLAPVSSDEAQKIPAVWSFRNNGRDEHAIVSAHSNIWPGAVAVAKSGKTDAACLYIGYGQRYLSALYSPPPPPAIQSEFVSKFNAEEDETDPIKEQVDPLPPAEFDEKQVEPDEKKEDDEGDEPEEEEEPEE